MAEPIFVDFTMSKIAIGAPLTGGEFEFGIFDQYERELYRTTNDETGLVKFENVQFDEPDMYYYTIKELDGPAGWELDDRIWPVEIEVILAEEEEEEDRLQAFVTYPEGVPSFVNRHESAACGSFVFPELPLDEPGEFVFTLREETPSGGGWDTDDSIIEVRVTVLDDGHGNLVATISYPNGFPSFTNTYTAAPARIIINGCKIAVGAPLPEGRFTFGLYDEWGRLISTTTNGPAEETL